MEPTDPMIAVRESWRNKDKQLGHEDNKLTNREKVIKN